MQSSRLYQGQPLGPFPAEIVRNIARQDPQTYAGLARASSRVRRVVQSTLQQVCQAPIRGFEIVRVLTSSPIFRLESASGSETLLLQLTPYNEVEIKNDNHPYNILSIRPLNSAGEDIDYFLNSGFKPNLYLVAKVYENRLSCAQQNPNYATEFLAREYLNRYRSIQGYITYPPYYFTQLRHLVNELSNASGQEFNSFYYELDPELETEDDLQYWIQQIELDSRRLMNLIKFQEHVQSTGNKVPRLNRLRLSQ